MQMAHNGFRTPQWDEESTRRSSTTGSFREVGRASCFFRAVIGQAELYRRGGRASSSFEHAIIGQANFTSDWDAYVAEWRRRGGDRLTEEANRQRDSM